MKIEGREAGLREDEGLVACREGGWRLAAGVDKDKVERQMDRGS